MSYVLYVYSALRIHEIHQNSNSEIVLLFDVYSIFNVKGVIACSLCSDTCAWSSKVEQTHILTTCKNMYKIVYLRGFMLSSCVHVIMGMLALPMLVQIQSTGRPAQSNPRKVVRKSCNLDFLIALVADTFEAFILPRAPTLFSAVLPSGSHQCSKNGCRRTWPKFHSPLKQRKLFE